MLSTPMLETGRLVLRPLSPDDLGPMRRIFDDPAVRRYIFDDEPVSVGIARSLLDASARDFSDKGVGLFGVSLRGETELVGFCGFRLEEGIGEMELAYGLLPKWWGRGLATEAARECLRFAFEEVGLHWVVAGADEPNVASLRVIQKLGMRYVGKILPSSPKVPYFALAREDFGRQRGSSNPGFPPQTEPEPARRTHREEALRRVAPPPTRQERGKGTGMQQSRTPAEARESPRERGTPRSTSKKGDKRMMSTVFEKARWIGKAAVLALCLAVVAGLVLAAVSDTAEAKKRKNRHNPPAAIPVFYLNVENAVSAISSLVGEVDGPLLRLDNNGAGDNSAGLDVRVESGKAPITVNPEAGKATNLDSDKLDGQDSTAFLPSKTYTKEGDEVSAEEGTFGTATATCDPGDIALSGGYQFGVAGGLLGLERTEGDTYIMSFEGPNSATANVTCADLPSLR